MTAETSLQLIAIAAVLALGLLLEAVGRRMHVPRITLLVLAGVALGGSGLDVLPDVTAHERTFVAEVALTMVAFLLGGEFSAKALRAHGRAILTVSVAVSLASLAVIAGGLALAGVPLALALLLAGIGLATDPAAVRDVIAETGAKGPLTATLQGVVAIDDAWAVILFSALLGLIVVNGAGHGGGENGLAIGLMHGLAEVGGALAVGAAVGVVGAYATGRVKEGQPSLVEALAIVLFCAGISVQLNISFLLTGMTAGAVIVNMAKHHTHPFHEIEYISWPILIVFFVLAGASVDLGAVWQIGALGAGFMALRLLSRVAGGWIGGRLGGLDAEASREIGLALTPQAGVALGMAIVAGQAVPAHAGTLMTVTVATTIVFELIGPLLARRALVRAGEVTAL